MIKERKIGNREFIALMAVLMSFVALAIDAMLPALVQIGTSLSVENANDTQLVISSIFIGMAVGQMLYGPASDSYGRKPVMYLGLGIFMVGCMISYVSQSFEVMLFGRVIQGLGASSARIVTTSMVRDRFTGTQMAKTMSMIMIIFILVPVFAPTIGQLILFTGSWRDIFLFMLFLSIVCFSWFALRQEETLRDENKHDFSFANIYKNILITVKNKKAIGYTFAAGLIFGAFLGYLTTSQQVLQIQFGLGEKFPIFFALLAMSVGLASFVNSKLVERLGMLRLCIISLSCIVIVSSFILGVYFASGSTLSFPIFFCFLAFILFCFGILFGNFSALSLEPLGHIAGTANSIISSIQTIISITIGSFIGQSYNGTVLPIIIGFILCGIFSLLIVLFINRK